MSAEWGRAARTPETAAAVAGALAELAVQELRIEPEERHEPRLVRSRETDLPRLILALYPCRIVWAGGELRVRGTEIAWRAEAEQATVIRASLGAVDPG